MSEQQLDQLKAKYQSVLNFMSQLGVQLQNLHVQDNKLVIRGQAKTKADSNKVWDQIKLVDPNYADLTAQIDAPAVAAAAAGGAPVSGARTYTVQPGDNLSHISKHFYGDPNQYAKIVEANKDKISDPDKIRAGMELIIP